MPALAAAGGGNSYQPVIVRIPAPWTDKGFIDYVDEQLWKRRRS